MKEMREIMVFILPHLALSGWGGGCAPVKWRGGCFSSFRCSTLFPRLKYWGALCRQAQYRCFKVTMAARKLCPPRLICGPLIVLLAVCTARLTSLLGLFKFI